MDTTKDAEILRRWKAGEDGPTIAQAIGRGSTTVYRTLKRHGIEPSKAERRPKNDWRRKHTAEQEREIVGRYEAGEAVRSIARAYGCSTATIANAVKRSGARIRPIGGPRRLWSDREKQELLRLHHEGLSQERIANDLDTTQAQVSQMLRRLTGDQVRRAMKKGGRFTTSGGYTMVKVDAADPLVEMANSNFYILEHRLVMARSLGRPLERHETVHHLNGNRTDNRLENLQLRSGNHGKGMVYTCRDCGSHNVEARKL